jgi:phosphomannomutase
VSPLDYATESAALQWLEHDTDQRDRSELANDLRLASAGDVAALSRLHDGFGTPIAFGTAGLRARMMYGPSGMNVTNVRDFSQAVATVVEKDNACSDVQRVVIGYDGRHKSLEFAQAAASVFASRGMDVLLFPRPAPTPVLAFYVRHLAAAAGVMITASHNPPHDNGYKLYMADGRQIVSPTDSEIQEIRKTVVSDSSSDGHGYNLLPEDFLDAYVSRLKRREHPSALRVAYSAMHGVGAETVRALYKDEPLVDVRFFGPQEHPDPDFPTTPVPNPENQNSAKQLLDFATAIDADIAIANDPDADRCAVGVRDGVGRWRLLSGDEVGAILGQHLASEGVSGSFACSVVSSSLLGKIAARHGIEHHVTLTGFKWLSRAPRLSYAYEEAIGYCVDPSLVADKDGVSAMHLITSLASKLAYEGRSITEYLDDIFKEHGYHVTSQKTIPCQANLPAPTPQEITRALSGKDGWVCSGSTNLLLASGQDTGTSSTELNTLLGTTRVLVRKSGTEPIVKVYCETVIKDLSKEDQALALDLHEEIALLINTNIELAKKYRTEM